MTPEPEFTELKVGHSPLNDMAAVIETARLAVEPKEVDVDTVYAVVDGERVVPLDLERFMAVPRRRRGRYLPATVDAFKAYVARFATEEATTVWVHPTSGEIVAVIDDHTQETPDWREHTAQTQLQHTPEWMHWIGKDGQMLGQVAFAEHIEDGLPEIRDPDGATMLEVAQTFHAHTTAQFRSSNRLHSGETRLQYDEEVKASAGASGDMVVPSELTLAIAPFVGEEAYKVLARLRFRVSSGQLTLGYRLDRPDAVVRDCLAKIVERLENEFPNVYLGSPPLWTSAAP